MNGLILFVVLPMAGIPLISLAAAWIQHFVTKFHVWMIVRTTNALRKDIETYQSKVILWNKEMAGLEEQMDAEEAELPAWQSRFYMILRDTPTSEQAKAVHGETERLLDKIRGIRQKFTFLLKDRDSLSAIHIKQIDRLGDLKKTLEQWRD
ncbi:uncharacterized protein N7518_004918 [Penicillium psychrosexuale]|uniref:uncharacterized protein n=1 Tax=Penicillium psychrosexuale TaxID=1002107 RepID=UPI0025459B22|nr:uncharacterized protein N7518_004918 [Penicillium psychrosexuale]KAJ5796378.1 hypothetical protein N7518_004918 [Penicillium psychrosexuale]